MYRLSFSVPCLLSLLFLPYLVSSAQGQNLSEEVVDQLNKEEFERLDEQGHPIPPPCFGSDGIG